MNKKLEELVKIVQTLRAPDGCDWDKKQTFTSLVPYLLEETYEVIEAIQDKNMNMLKEELGDLLLHVVFQAELASENEIFNISDVIESINTKLINRHPHIFDTQDRDNNWQKENWELAKQKEKKRKSVLDGIPKILPTPIKASRIQEKASSFGFDWNNVEDVKNKVYEELQELEEAIKEKNKQNIENEFGDLLFVLINLGRHLSIDADSSLNKAIRKFYNRFTKMEELIKKEKLDLKKLNLKELDLIWDRIKSQENK